MYLHNPRPQLAEALVGQRTDRARHLYLVGDDVGRARPCDVPGSTLHTAECRYLASNTKPAGLEAGQSEASANCCVHGEHCLFVATDRLAASHCLTAGHSGAQAARACITRRVLTIK